MADIELLKLLLPEYLVDYFDVITSEKKGEQLHLFFERKVKLNTDFNTALKVLTKK